MYYSKKQRKAQRSYKERQALASQHFANTPDINAKDFRITNQTPGMIQRLVARMFGRRGAI